MNPQLSILLASFQVKMILFQFYAYLLLTLRKNYMLKENS